MNERTKLITATGFGVAIGFALSLLMTESKKTETTTTKKLSSSSSESAFKIVRSFLDAQSERNLEKMCSLVHEDIVYINEPHPPERAIRGKKMFREVFEASPCIWCEEADLQILQSSYEGGDTVFVERFDRFKIDGIWLEIPNCGYLKVKDGKVILWKDYWDYTKYKDFTTKNYGPDFRLFRKTVKN